MLTTLLIAAVVFGSLIVSIVTYGTFWTGICGTGHMALLRERAQGCLWRCALQAFASSMASQLASVVLYPACLLKKCWLSSPGADPGPEAGPPVLFVHGYLHTSSAWIFFSSWFREAGYRDLHAMTYNSLARTFPEIVAQLEGQVRLLVNARPGRKVLLVGHSLGGLAIREFLNSSPLAVHVAAAATLGAPHQGSVLAGLGLSALGRSLCFRGSLVKSIEAHDKTPDAPCLSIYSPMDNMVLPQEGLRIRKAGWQEQEGAPVCHVGMLYHRPTAETVLDFLKRASGREHAGN